MFRRNASGSMARVVADGFDYSTLSTSISSPTAISHGAPRAGRVLTASR